MRRVNEMLIKHRIYLLLSLVVLIGSAYHGLLPGMTGDNVSYYTTTGYVDCLADKQEIFDIFNCEGPGGEAGSILTSNIPIYTASSIIARLSGSDASASYMLVSVFLMSIAIYLGFKFFYYFISSKLLSVFGIFLFVTSIHTLSMRGFGGTYWGFLLLPGLLFLSLKIFDRFVSSKRLKTGVIALGLMVVLDSILIFQDGYTLVLVNVFIAAFVLAQMLIKRNLKKSSMFVAILLFSLFLASVLFKTVYGTDIAGSSPPDFFRSMSADIVTFFLPTSNHFAWDLIGIGANWKSLWGDGSNTSNYIGIVGMFGIISSFIVLKNKNLRTDPKLLGLVIAAFVCLFMSLGPSLKVYDTKPESSGNTVSYKSYLMAQKEATITLPLTDRLYSTTPAIESMRAVYRWKYVSVVMLLCLSLFMINKLMAGNKRSIVWLPVVLFLFTLDFIAPYRFVQDNFSRNDQVNSFNLDVLYPLEALLPDDANVLFIPNAIGGNDFLVTYLSPLLDIRTENVGGDKGLKLAREQRDNIITHLLDKKDYTTNDKLSNELVRSGVDYIVVPKFDLRWDSYSWPPGEIYEGYYSVTKLLEESEIEKITEEEYFDVYVLPAANR
jgi:hypothetical protein